MDKQENNLPHFDTDEQKADYWDTHSPLDLTPIPKAEKIVVKRTKVEYRGKEYDMLSFDEALVEFDKQKEAGKKPAIVAWGQGYIIVKAILNGEKINDTTEK